MPLYPLYALLFADNGLSDAEISVLFAIWSMVGMVAEVPSGAVADRFSRRYALMASGVMQGAGYAVWILSPGFGGYAAGFALWAIAGALVSGSFEALLYDGLIAVEGQDHFGRVFGWVTGAGLFAQIPAALAATVLFGGGGYPLVGWVSVGCCLASSALASQLPDARPIKTGDPEPEPDGYLAVLRAGITEAAVHAGVRAAVLAVAALAGLDGIDEYFSLIAHDWGVTTALVPLAVLAIPLTGAVGAALGGVANRLGAPALAGAFVLGVAAFALAGALAHPAGLAGVAVFYGLYRMVLVVAQTRLQQRITGPARATVTSVAALASEVSAIALYAAWAFGGLPFVVGLMAGVALMLPRWLRFETT